MAKIENILEVIDSGISVVDAELNVKSWNKWLEIATGIRREDAVGKPLDSVVEIEPGKLSALKRNVKTSLSMKIATFMTPAAHGYLIKIPIKNPFLTSYEFMQQEVKIIPLEDDENLVCLFIADQTAIMDSNRTIEADRQKISDILDSQNGLLFITDGVKIKLANKRFLDYFGYESLEEYNENTRDCFAKHFEHIDGCFWVECAGTPNHCRWFADTKKDEHQKRFVAVKNRAGDISYFILQISEATGNGEYIVTLTEATKEFEFQKELQKRINEELEIRISQEHLLLRQSKLAMLGEMIAAISHQLKQPLNAIKLLSSDIEFLHKTKDMDEEQIFADIKMIYDQVDHMNATINSFRNFLAPSSGADSFDLINSLNGVFNIMQGALKDYRIDVNVKIDTQENSFIGSYQELKSANCRPIPISGKENDFKQVLINLISNTKDALSEKRDSTASMGTVIIQVQEHKDGKIILRYKDNAGGIPKEIMPVLFQPYKTSKGEKGDGLGLYISKNIIEKMGGTIEAANTNDGAIFTLTLQSAKK